MIPSRIQEVINSDIDALPCLHSGHFANLVYDDGEWRVFKMRLAEADDYHGPHVVVERLYNGVWVEVES